MLNDGIRLDLDELEGILWKWQECVSICLAIGNGLNVVMLWMFVMERMTLQNILNLDIH